MAYVDQPGTAEQDKLNAQSPLNQPPTTGSAVGSGAGDKTPNQPSSSVAPAPFTNLGSYLAVNAPQIQGMADKVAGQLGQTYNTAKGAVDTGAQGVQSAINAGYAAPNQELVNQAATNPTEFAAKPENVSAFQAQYNDKYAGPTSFETTPDYATAQGAVQSAVNEAANVGNYGGLQSYLTRNVESNPTQAMSALDTALLNQSPEAIQTVNTAAQKFPGLNDYLSQVAGEQNKNITSAQKAAAENAAAVQGRFTGEGGVIPTFGSALDTRTQQAREAALTDQQKVTQLLNNLRSNMPRLQEWNPSDIRNNAIAITNPDGSYRAPTEDEYKLLEREMGTNQRQVDPVTGKMIQPNINDTLAMIEYLKQGYKTDAQGAVRENPYDFKLSNYLTNLSPDAEITRANAATPEDYAKQKALAMLTGSNIPFLGEENIGQAGKAPIDLANFDTNKMTQDLLSLFGNIGGKQYPVNPYTQPLPPPPPPVVPKPPVEPPAPPPPDPYAPPDTDSTNKPPGWKPENVKYIGDEKVWWSPNDKKWIPAPEEFAMRDGQRMQFDYNTGKYIPVDETTGTTRKLF